MTIKDIIDTPINDLWNTISPFAMGYMIFFTIFFILVLSFIAYVFVKVIKGHKEFEKRRKERSKRKW